MTAQRGTGAASDRVPAPLADRERRLTPRRLRRPLVVLLSGLACLCGAIAIQAAPALADGDPGSDVLVYQNLFAASDAGLSIHQQLQLTDLLDATEAVRAPVRVAIIAHRDDLGTVTALWRKPSVYARYLGIELSLAYSGRLIVVMPDGFGFYWNGHSPASGEAALHGLTVGPGAGGLVHATEAAVQRVEIGAGVSPSALSSALRHAPAGAAAAARSASSGSGALATPGASTSASRARSAPALSPWIVGLVLAALLASPFWAPALVRRLRAGVRRRPRATTPVAGPPIRSRLPRPMALALPLGAMLLAAALVAVILVAPGTGADQQAAFLARNPDLDPGTAIRPRPAPNFTLTDQFGRRISLSQYRGKVVLLAFVDAECQTICPLTTEAMLDAKRMLGSHADQVALLGVDANRKSTSIEDVSSYSQLHGMTDDWQFLTGSLPQLQRVWSSYSIGAEVTNGLVNHTPALYVIDPQGRERTVYITQSAYAAVPQLGQLLAREASRLLPGHPAVHGDLSYAPIPGIPPTRAVRIPEPGGGHLQLGPGHPRLYLFFATWDQESTPIAAHLEQLDAYARTAAREHLPPVAAIDEGSVEPDAAALPAFLHTLPGRLDYPVGIDRTGRLADGYKVQGEPWYVLTSPSGKIIWYQEIYTGGWPSESELLTQVRAAISRTPAAPTSATAAQAALRGSPAPLAALHADASRLLGRPALGIRPLQYQLQALRGYPVVLNAWASWCTACQSEFKILEAASVRFGKRVAFLGVDTQDSSPQAAQQFLDHHYLSYPSYQAQSEGSLTALYPPGIEGLPTTFLINSRGRIVQTVSGAFASQGTLDHYIEADLLH